MKRSKAGRPPKASSERRNDTITFRVRASLGDRLRKTASKSNRSLSDEIEYRLMHSLAVEEQFRDLDEYVEKTKRTSRIQHGLEPSPGGFMSAEDAAKPFKPAPIVPPALKEAMKTAAREVLAEEGIKDALREVLAEAGIVGRKGAA
jgi:hypothetical protein